MFQINMIWATDPNGVIGSNNDLVFRSRKDLQRFKELTTDGNNAVVMGRNTFESMGSKLLKNRINLVLSKDINFKSTDDMYVCRSINAVLHICQLNQIDKLWVIGGSEIYNQFIDLADELHITHFNEYFEPNKTSKVTYFIPDLTWFKPTKEELFTDNEYSGSFTTYKRELL